MDEATRQAWNAAVATAAADPSPENIAARDALRERILTSVHQHIMADDRYQERTH